MTTITPSNEKDVPVVPLHIELRDYFAAKAISTLIYTRDARDGGWDPVSMAADCYAVADAMLKAREVKHV